MGNNKIDGNIYREFIDFGTRNLALNRVVVNNLNVFPVRDGDTGDNMMLTIQGGVNAIRDSVSQKLNEIASSCSNGMLLNARGNSGVILSQFFYGIAQGLEGKEEASFYEFTKALAEGVKCAYNAVDNATEGTILTVARKTSENLSKNVDSYTSLEEFVSDLMSFCKDAVQNTPDELPVLKEAGVVDSGGAGLYYIFEGFYKYLHGQDIEIEIAGTNTTELDLSKFNENSELEFGYCSEVLVQLQKSKVDIDNFDVEELRKFLNSIGDSIVLVKTGSIIKVHVHTFKPYKLLQKCQEFGEFLKVKIENMTLQSEQVTTENQFTFTQTKSKERKQNAVVVVANGEGLKQTFMDMGASYVIDGGQTNNPSTKDFLNAFEMVNADNIFVFPNNKNIILAAKQAAEIYKASNVVVLESKNIAQGYSALSMFDFTSNDIEGIIENANYEMEHCSLGMITRAARTTTISNVTIQQDDYMCFLDKELFGANAVKIRSIYLLFDKMISKGAGFGTLIYGKELREEEKKLLKDYLKEKYPSFEYYEIEGGQDIYDLYIITNN